jgi:predicted RNase H-like nuclease (RuvC/YqgF family)
VAKKPTYEALEQRVQSLEEQNRALMASIEDQRKRLEERIKFEKDLREKVWKELKQDLEFERLLSEVSAKFANLPAKEVDREIKDVLRRSAGMFELDRGSVMQYSKDLGQIHATHSWAREGLPEFFVLSAGGRFVSKEPTNHERV